MTIAGVVLAGGLSRRMGGGDKCLRELQGRPILAHIVERARPQVGALAINANGDPERFAPFRLPVIADGVPEFAGPLAGVLAGLDWAAESVPGCGIVASFAGDAPFLPIDLVERLSSSLAAGAFDLACASSGGRVHPVFGLWPVALRGELRRAMVEDGIRKVDLWTARYRLAVIDFPTSAIDPFFNVNRPDDLAAAERFAASSGDAKI
ncbi:MAG TPA: molybdenum cofactor guanylyltransferase MobA [Stellaceae bacterium]|nr:molybdenum cofactor guanylyltransferase MobA [Stellaceae bacterium]